MKLPPLISVPLSWLYGMVVHIRHKLFDLKILRSEEFDIPVVCIGNLTVGGTGKTPVAELLIERFSEHYRVGVLSRGYRRKTKGFVLSTPTSSARTIGDEQRALLVGICGPSDAAYAISGCFLRCWNGCWWSCCWYG